MVYGAYRATNGRIMADMDFGDAFDALADTETWMQGILVVVGVVVPALIAKVESSGFSIPNEVYGIGVIAGAEMLVPGEYRREIQAGAAGNVAVTAANRSDALAKHLPTLYEGGN